MASKVDTHPERDRIARELVAGVPFRTIHAWSGISLGALSRYLAQLRYEMGTALKALGPAESAERGSKLLQRVERLIAQAECVLIDSRVKDDLRAANGALGAAAKLLTLVGQLTGELQGANSGGLHLTMNRVTNTTVYNYGDDTELALLIQEATHNFDAGEIARLQRLAVSVTVGHKQARENKALPARLNTD